jgi:hypothetical protein
MYEFLFFFPIYDRSTPSPLTTAVLTAAEQTAYATPDHKPKKLKNKAKHGQIGGTQSS